MRLLFGKTNFLKLTEWGEKTVADSECEYCADARDRTQSWVLLENEAHHWKPVLGWGGVT